MATPRKDPLKEKDREISLLHELVRITSENPQPDHLLCQLCKLTANQMKADSVLIYLFSDNREELILSGSQSDVPANGQVRLKLGEGITGWVAEKRKSVAISKNASEDPRFKFFYSLQEDRFEAFLSVPIILRSELIGVLNIHHKKAHAHTESEKQLAQTIAHEIASVISYSQLDLNIRRRTQQIEALARVTQSIAQGIYIREILQLIVTMTAEMMSSKICSLMLLDEKGKELRIEATQSLSEEYKTKPPVQLRASISGRAVLEKKAIFVEDVTKDPLYGFPQIAKKESLRSLLVVPMHTKDRVIGVLNCYTTKIHRFSADEVQLVQAVANQAAIAIEHTRALELAMQAQEALETRKVVERAKGILMRMQNMNEEAAFRIIQRQAMDRRKSMKEVAEAIILSEEIQQTKSHK